MGLQLANASTTKEDCRAFCCKDPACEVWQFGLGREERVSDPTNARMKCYAGRGFACHSERMDDFVVYYGQRVSHGSVHKQTKLKGGVWCTGSGMANRSIASGQGGQSHTTRSDKCRDDCYKDYNCRVWQYSTTKGCWYGTATECLEDASLQGTIIDAESVEHTCPTKDVRKTNYTLVIALILVAGWILFMLAVGVLVLGFCRQSGKPGSRRSTTATSRQRSDGEDSDAEEEEAHSSPGSQFTSRSSDSPRKQNAPAYMALNTPGVQLGSDQSGRLQLTSRLPSPQASFSSFGGSSQHSQSPLLH